MRTFLLRRCILIMCPNCSIQNQWADMFPSIISRAQALEMLSTGGAGSYDGAIQLVIVQFKSCIHKAFLRKNDIACLIS